ncbi:serine hydrolase [Luteimonas mephitis]|uniref:serine hydrolase n=1 Tax=Luteimonas mephitis TaxID=83615 RepID=UPI0004145D3A|nr:serine hydrolase [Luteimonas mephitis]
MPAASTLLRRACLVATIALSGAAAFAAAAQPAATPAEATQAGDSLPAALQDLDAYVERVRGQFDVPGIAVAVVKDGQVVLERGYGVRKLGEPATVDAHTAFAIASNTKAFTAASISILADEGKLKPEDRVIDHLPWFRMSDAYITREMRIRDLLAHRSGLGLGAGDLLFWPTTTYSAREVAERLRDVPISGGFRERYAYDNILFGVAQQVIEAASGMSYEQFLRTRIFGPLGMAETRFNADYLKPGDNVATGHAKFDFKDLRPVAPLTWSNVAGAGGIYSSVHDLSKWMRVQLDGGVMSGDGDDAKRLFSAKRQKEMWSVLTPIPISEPSVPELAATKPNFLGYGEGWVLADYRGSKLVYHTGGWPGMVSRLTLVPEQKLGVVVLTSAEAGAAFNAITMRVLDAYLDAPRTDWVAAYAAAMAKSQGNADESWQKHVAARDAGSKPSLPLDGYAGTYRDPWYGDVVLSRNGKGLQIQFAKTAQLLGDLEHWQHDTFIVRWRDRSLNADAFLSFSLDPDGRIVEARIVPVSPLTDFSFDFQDLRLAPVDEE